MEGGEGGRGAKKDRYLINVLEEEEAVLGHRDEAIRPGGHSKPHSHESLGL